MPTSRHRLHLQDTTPTLAAASVQSNDETLLARFDVEFSGIRLRDLRLVANKNGAYRVAVPKDPWTGAQACELSAEVARRVIEAARAALERC